MEQVLLYLLIGAGVLAVAGSNSPVGAAPIVPTQPITPIVPVIPTPVLPGPVSVVPVQNPVTTAPKTVIDSSGAVWTLGGNTAPYPVLREGSHMGGAYGFDLRMSGGQVQVLGEDHNWWGWTGSGWQFAVRTTPIPTVPLPPVIVIGPTVPSLPYVPLPSQGPVTVHPTTLGYGMEISTYYRLKVGGRDVTVYKGRGIVEYHWAHVDALSPVSVEVTSLVKSLGNTRILPTSSGITSSVSGSVAMFNVVKTPTYLSFEPNGEDNPLLLFVNAPETSRPSQSDPNVMWYGPGYHNIGNLVVGSNKTLYMAGGAVLRGTITTRGSNIKILGRGVLQGNGLFVSDRYAARDPQLLTIRMSQNVLIDGPVIKESAKWTIVISQSDGVTIRNLKEMSIMGPNYHDGTHIENSRNVLMEDLFLMSDDDTFGVRGVEYAQMEPVEHIMVRRVVAWPTATGAWRLGWTGFTTYINDVQYEDIDVIHAKTYHAILKFEPAGNGTVATRMSNFRFERITMQPSGGAWEGEFIRVVAELGDPLAKGPAGSVENVLFKNVHLIGSRASGSFPQGLIEVWGHNPTNQFVRNITFENVTRWGERVTANSSYVKIGVSGAPANSTTGVTFR